VPCEGEITRLLTAIKGGNRQAQSELIPLVYDELRRLARRYMRTERPEHTLQPTALVHEAYLKLVDEPSIDWQGRAHFFAVAARLMRRILVDHARAHRAVKRGGIEPKIVLEEDLVFAEEKADQLVELDGALDQLAEQDPRQAQIVEMRFFGGLSVEETAEVLEISPRTVKRDWTVARAWLYEEINKRS
jgi:RNA polymerase sigma factor (TIGR02999 family)